MIAFCTSFAGDQPAFVDRLRTLGNKTPIMNSWAGDGAYWWSKNPKVTNFYFVTYAGAVAKDPDPAVRAFEAKMTALGKKYAAQTGGFITGADAIDAIAYAIKKTGGSTDGAKLAATLSHLTKFKTLGGPITFTPTFHSVTGRPYRVIEVNNNVAKVIGEHTTKVVAEHPLSELGGGSGQASHARAARLAPGPRRLSFVRGDPRARGRRSRAGARRGARPDRAERRRQDDARQPADRLRPAVVRADRARRRRRSRAGRRTGAAAPGSRGRSSTGGSSAG